MTVRGWHEHPQQRGTAQALAPIGTCLCRCEPFRAPDRAHADYRIARPQRHSGGRVCCHQPPPTQYYPSPVRLGDWSVGDVCSWLQQLDSPACVELVPLFRHHGINGSVLRKLSVKMLVELGVREVTALVLLDARDRIPTA